MKWRLILLPATLTIIAATFLFGHGASNTQTSSKSDEYQSIILYPSSNSISLDFYLSLLQSNDWHIVRGREISVEWQKKSAATAETHLTNSISRLGETPLAERVVALAYLAKLELLETEWCAWTNYVEKIMELDNMIRKQRTEKFDAFISE